ncbi:MAG: diacylglycerol/lipid kinase family protein [Sandaracinaceae bacterium]
MSEGHGAPSWLALVNPVAGGGRCGSTARAALGALRAQGLDIEERWTEAAGDARRIAREAASSGRRHFLTVGGDGTTYEVINGLFPRPEAAPRPVLGMLPLGTGNSFLRDFGIRDAQQAASSLALGATRRVDVIRAEHDGGLLHYLNLLSVGFTAAAGDLTNRRFKGLGAAGYVAAALLTAARLETPVFPLRVDGGERDERPCVLLSFSNSRFTGGAMEISPESSPTDGALDVVRVGAMSALSFLWTFPSVFRGTHLRHPEICSRRARRVDLDLAGPVDVMVDGEVERVRLTRLEVVPGALEVVA